MSNFWGALQSEVQLTATVSKTKSTEPLWQQAISNLSKLDVLFKEGTVIRKRIIISSIFSDKSTFDGSQYRITRINEAVELMCLIDKQLKSIKKGTNADISDLSQFVTPQRLELWTR